MREEAMMYSVLLFMFAGVAGRSDSVEKPNFVFFLSDDQLKADYGCYGMPLNLTPVTDRLAKEGLVFEQMLAPQAICAPGRSTLFTGQYPVRHGCFMNHIAVRQGTKTVYDALKPLGYDVALAGKLHVKPSSVFRWDVCIGPEGDRSLDFKRIDEYLSKSKNKPFCLFICSGYPHGPYPENPGFPVEKTVVHPYMKGQTKLLAGYYDNIAIKEAELEQVLAMLSTHGLEQNTVFIYSADHGNGTGAKFTVYDRGLNVPFIVRYPGKIKPGRTAVLASFTDILPTFVEMAGGSPLDDVDGLSLCPVLQGKTTRHHETVFGLMTQQGVWESYIFPRRSARGNRYHYIHNFNTMERIRLDQQAGKKIDPFRLLGAQKHPDIPEEELYDTQEDPFELVNLAGDLGYAGIKAELKKDLFAWMKQQNDFLQEGGDIPYLKGVHRIDQSNQYNQIPSELENTIPPEQFLCPHELTAGPPQAAP
jgi:arylsulfatase A-like enzyme